MVRSPVRIQGKSMSSHITRSIIQYKGSQQIIRQPVKCTCLGTTVQIKTTCTKTLKGRLDLHSGNKLWSEYVTVSHLKTWILKKYKIIAWALNLVSRRYCRCCGKKVRGRWLAPKWSDRKFSWCLQTKNFLIWGLGIILGEWVLLPRPLSSTLSLRTYTMLHAQLQLHTFKKSVKLIKYETKHT